MSNITSIIKEKHRTSVFVAHRLRTIFDSDQIIVLKDGELAGKPGTHEELVNAGGVYSNLWAVQETSPVDEAGEKKIAENVKKLNV